MDTVKHTLRQDIEEVLDNIHEDGKLTNPKDVIGSNKVPLNLLPGTAMAEWALAQLEGALKYGTHNWRIAGVRASIYVAAAFRHLEKFWNGQDRDPKTLVHHLGSVMACCAIVLDAAAAGKLNDDRPPAVAVDEYIDGLEANVKHLKELFKDHNPRHYTIADTER